MQRAEAIRTAPNGDALYAVKGSPIPTEALEAFTPGFSAAWKVGGLIDDNGVGLTPNKETDSIPVWQSAAPGKYYVTGASFDVEINFAQYDATVMRLYYGVDFVLTGSGNSAKLVISSNPPLDELMLAVRWLGDNGSHNVMIIERGMVTNRNQIKVNRTEGTMSGVTFSAMDLNGNLATLLTDDPEVLDLL